MKPPEPRPASARPPGANPICPPHQAANSGPAWRPGHENDARLLRLLVVNASTNSGIDRAVATRSMGKQGIHSLAPCPCSERQRRSASVVDCASAFSGARLRPMPERIALAQTRLRADVESPSIGAPQLCSDTPQQDLLVGRRQAPIPGRLADNGRSGGMSFYLASSPLASEAMGTTQAHSRDASRQKDSSTIPLPPRATMPR